MMSFDPTHIMDLGKLSDEELETAFNEALDIGDAKTAMAAADEMQCRAEAQREAANEALRRAGGKLDTPLREVTDARWRSH